MDDIEEKKVEISSSRKFVSWLKENNISLAFSTYQTAKLFLIGQKPGQEKMSIFERTFDRCMGLKLDGDSLYVSTRYQLWRLVNILEPTQLHNDYDALYVPQMCYVTGDIDIHDIIINPKGNIIFANTLFSCLSTVSDKHSFSPLWKPTFISKLAAEDRCHLNGIAADENKIPRYVSVVSQTDFHEGWREYKKEGGSIIEIESNEVICTGLSMPHSPRLYRDKLWVLNSGTGYFGYIDTKTGKFEEVAFCCGYLRGLDFVDHYAVVGLSAPRENSLFTGLALEDNLKKKKAEPRCSILVIDLNTGDIVHSIKITGLVRELYDVVVIPNIKRPMAIGFKSDEINHTLNIGDENISLDGR